MKSRRREIVHEPDPFTTVPPEIIFTILNERNIADVLSFCNSNKYYHQVCTMDALWQQLYYKYYGHTKMVELVGIVDWMWLVRLCYQLSQLTTGNIRQLYNKTGITYSNLQTVSPAIGVLKNLTQLTITKGQFSDIPLEIGNLVNLESLSIFYCPLVRYLPNTIGNLSKLQLLNITHCGLMDITEAIARLINLQELVLKDNIISHLPPEITLLTNLQQLDVSDNALRYIAPAIGQLPHLQLLDIKNNPIHVTNAVWAQFRHIEMFIY